MSHPEGFHRHFSPHYSNIPVHEAVIVINTLNVQDAKDIEYLCNLYSITYHTSRSNGTAGKGKNCLLETFIASKDEYCVMIDGDDYITPAGYEMYKRIAAAQTVPDAVCLTAQSAYVMEGSPWEPMIRPQRVFAAPKDAVDYDATETMLRSTNSDEESVQLYLDYHKEYYSQQQKYCEGVDLHNRVVFYSRKAAEYTFCEESQVGEDTLHFYTLKDAHMRGEIVMVVNVECPATYIYNRKDPRTSVVYKVTKGYQYWNWMGEYNEKVRKLEEEGKLHEDSLPVLFFNYEEIPNMNDLGTEGGVEFEENGLSIILPANSSPKSIDSLLFKYGRSKEK